MAVRRTVLSGLVICVGTLLAGVSPAMGQTSSCMMGESQAAGGSCEQGVCDDPDERDLWLTGATTSMLEIPIKFIVLCAYDPLDGCAASEAQILAQFADLNNAYNADYKIKFVPDPPPIVSVNDPNSTNRFFNFCSDPGATCTGPVDDFSCHDPTGTEGLAMKTQFADNPNGQLNVYVTNVFASFRGQGFFPWCDDPTGVMRGVIIDAAKTGGEFDCGGNPCRMLVHEIGHVLGLWHTNRGTTPSAEGIECCENSGCDCEDETCSRVGDLCCDTPPTLGANRCGSEQGEGCSHDYPDEGDFTNYMDRGLDGCWDHFTDQQSGRMHCWTCESMTGFLSGEPNGACCRSGGMRIMVRCSF